MSFRRNLIESWKRVSQPPVRSDMKGEFRPDQELELDELPAELKEIGSVK